MQIIFIEAGIEHVCNISNRNFQKFPLAFRAGQFVDDTFYCRQFDLYNVNVESIVICKTALKNMVRPMPVHLWLRKPSNII